MTDHEEKQASTESLPKARIETNWRRYLFWLIPIGAAAVAAWFIYTEVISKGPKIYVYFDNAAELQAGKSQIKFRGVQIGDIEAVELTEDNHRVKATVSLARSARNVARQGSVFWIVKPQIGLNQITGVQAIMGGDYLTVQPGTGKRQTVFQGSPEPPASQKEEPGLRIVLLAEKLGTVKQHSPVLYHGVQVGDVHASELGPEAQAVYIFLNIEKKYAPLVRMNSRFWNAGGAQVSLGWTGISMKAQSVSTLLTGGIDFATPDTKEKEAYDGAPFRLYEQPESSWQRWFPTIRLPLIAGGRQPGREQKGR
jgi:paraquat-inducible protein B